MRLRCRAVFVVPTALDRADDDRDGVQSGRGAARQLPGRLERRRKAVWTHDAEQLGPQLVVPVDPRWPVDPVRAVGHFRHASLLRPTRHPRSRIDRFADSDDQSHPSIGLQQSRLAQALQVSFCT